MFLTVLTGRFSNFWSENSRFAEDSTDKDEKGDCIAVYCDQNDSLNFLKKKIFWAVAMATIIFTIPQFVLFNLWGEQRLKLRGLLFERFLNPKVLFFQSPMLKYNYSRE